MTVSPLPKCAVPKSQAYLMIVPEPALEPAPLKVTEWFTIAVEGPLMTAVGGTGMGVGVCVGVGTGVDVAVGVAVGGLGVDVEVGVDVTVGVDVGVTGVAVGVFVAVGGIGVAVGVFVAVGVGVDVGVAVGGPSGAMATTSAAVALAPSSSNMVKVTIKLPEVE